MELYIKVINNGVMGIKIRNIGKFSLTGRMS